MADLDEVARGIGTFDGAGAHSQLVGSGWHVLWIGNHVNAPNGPAEFQVGAGVAVGELEVLLLVGIGAVVAARKGKGGFVAVPESKLRGIRRTFEEVGVLIESEIVLEVDAIVEVVFLADLGKSFFVLRQKCDLVDFGFPEQIALVGFLQCGHLLAALHIDSVLRFDAEDFGRLTFGGPAFEPFTDCAATEFEVLLDLVTGNKLGRALRIEGAATPIGGQGADINLEA